MFFIVVSHKEEYREAAELIIEMCHELSIATSLVDIDQADVSLCSRRDIVFFLTNDTRVSQIAIEFYSRGVQSINIEYIMGDRTKSHAQCRIQSAKLSVPSQIKRINIYHPNSKRVTYPLYLKSENHASGTYKITSHDELLRIIHTLDSSLEWYVEDAVDGPDRHIIKTYWIAGMCFAKDGAPALPLDVTRAMHTIGLLFSFDTFSADFIVNDNYYWCIDINPAPGFFGSQNAREFFARSLHMFPFNKKKSFAEIYKKSIETHGGIKKYIARKMHRSTGMLVHRLLKTAPHTARILEVGAGTGALSAVLAQQGLELTAIDHDRKMLPIIQASFNVLKTKGIIHVSNAFTLEKKFMPNSFEYAISHGVMEHYNDACIAKLLQSQFAVAKRVVCVVPTAAMSYAYRHRGLGDERYCTTKQWLAIIHRCGYTVEAVYGFGSKETIYKYIPEIFWRWSVTTKLLAPFAAFNEFWIIKNESFSQSHQ